VKLLTNRQLPIYAISAIGPNLLMLIVSAYLIDALSTAGFVQNIESWTFAGKTIVSVGLFSVLITIAKIIDGIIDIPLAAFTDKLKTKWGKRRPSILIGFIPMILTYIALCFPLSTEKGSMLNTIWIFVILVLFFTSYTLCMVTYYGTFSDVTDTVQKRNKLSFFKSAYDTIIYAVGYALIPLIVGFSINIQIIAIMCIPLALTMIIPLILLKEESSIKSTPNENIPFFESIRLSIKNRPFVLWLLVFGVFYFGLQMFLVGQNVLASGTMGLNGWQIAIINTIAFAPVPLMLFIYNKVMKRYGFRIAFQSAILSFAIAMVFFLLANIHIFDEVYPRMIIAAIGSFIGSYGIGAFFSSPYIIPSNIAANERNDTGKHHPSMYFAIQGLITALSGAISTGIVWLNIKELALNGDTTFGPQLMPFIVFGICILSFALSFLLPVMFKNLGKIKQKVDTDD